MNRLSKAAPMNASPTPKSLHPAIQWMAVLLLFYSFLMGWMGDVPRKVILNESVRNLYFHVPMWFGMLLMLLGSAVYSVRYLLFQQSIDDTQAQSLGLVGLLFGFLGLVTGMVWAQFTWGPGGAVTPSKTLPPLACSCIWPTWFCALRLRMPNAEPAWRLFTMCWRFFV